MGWRGVGVLREQVSTTQATRAQPSILLSAVKVLLASLRSTLAAGQAELGMTAC